MSSPKREAIAGKTDHEGAVVGAYVALVADNAIRPVASLTWPLLDDVIDAALEACLLAMAGNGHRRSRP